jgi:myo-inositol-1(or 4)-monophosphatase
MKSFIEELVTVSEDIKSFINERKTISFKKDFSDLVTNYDLVMEENFIKIIQNYFPNSSIVSEETGKIVKSEEDVFYIDPIDGTNNFAHAIPLCATSIARVVSGKPIFGFISIPVLNLNLYAIKDKGSFLNFERIKVSENAEFNFSVFSTGFRHYSKSKRILEFLKDKIQGLRMFGSAAVAMSFVSSGKTELYWEYDLAPWDIAAGKLIVEEAGGKVLDSNLEDFLIFDGKSYDVVAYNGFLNIKEVFSHDGQYI